MSINNSEKNDRKSQLFGDKYVPYEEFGFLKNKKIRFPIIFAFLFFGVFWNGAEVPDFESAPRHITVGKYYCPLVGAVDMEMRKLMILLITTTGRRYLDFAIEDIVVITLITKKSWQLNGFSFAINESLFQYTIL